PALVRAQALLSRMLRQARAKEFTFIARSGIYVGFLIGCVQALAWYFTHTPLLLPLFGIFTGWFTDWLALKMIFFPIRPRRFGPGTWQGLFLATSPDRTRVGGWGRRSSSARDRKSTRLNSSHGSESYADFCLKK